jgi:hypothetical protein
MMKAPQPAHPSGGDIYPLQRMSAASSECHCAFCGAPVPAEHAHLLDRASQRLTCACGPCAVLATAEKNPRYLRVANEFRRLEDCDFNDPEWEALMAPTGLTILVRDAQDRIFVIDPTPADDAGAGPGELPLPPCAAEHPVPAGLWRSLIAAHPSLRALQPEVDALLIHRLGPEPECFLVPRDEANRLTALLQQNWRGLSGGFDLWRAVARFFDDVRGRSTCPQARCA